MKKKKTNSITRVILCFVTLITLFCASNAQMTLNQNFIDFGTNNWPIRYEKGFAIVAIYDQNNSNMATLVDTITPQVSLRTFSRNHMVEQGSDGSIAALIVADTTPMYLTPKFSDFFDHNAIGALYQNATREYQTNVAQSQVLVARTAENTGRYIIHTCCSGYAIGSATNDTMGITHGNLPLTMPLQLIPCGAKNIIREPNKLIVEQGGVTQDYPLPTSTDTIFYGNGEYMTSTSYDSKLFDSVCSTFGYYNQSQAYLHTLSLNTGVSTTRYIQYPGVNMGQLVCDSIVIIDSMLCKIGNTGQITQTLITPYHVGDVGLFLDGNYIIMYELFDAVSSGIGVTIAKVSTQTMTIVDTITLSMEMILGAKKENGRYLFWGAENTTIPWVFQGSANGVLRYVTP